MIGDTYYPVTVRCAVVLVFVGGRGDIDWPVTVHCVVVLEFVGDRGDTY